MNLDKFNLFKSDIALNKTRRLGDEYKDATGKTVGLIDNVKIASGDFALLICPNGYEYVAMGTPKGNLLLCNSFSRVVVITTKELAKNFADVRCISDAEFEDHFFASSNLGHRLEKEQAEATKTE